MQAMPDDVIKIDNGIMRFEGPGRYARNVDLDAEPITFCRNITACDRTRFSPGRLRRAEGSYPRRYRASWAKMVQLLTRMYKAAFQSFPAPTAPASRLSANWRFTTRQV